MVTLALTLWRKLVGPTGEVKNMFFDKLILVILCAATLFFGVACYKTYSLSYSCPSCVVQCTHYHNALIDGDLMAMLLFVLLLLIHGVSMDLRRKVHG
jgi:hypothetical protein